MNALIIYDSFDSAVKANGILGRAAQRMDLTADWTVKLWRSDVLRLPRASEAALTEAAEAHLVLIAVREIVSNLPWLLDWLERWARGRQIPEAALAIWQVEATDSGATQAAPELTRFAGHHGLTLICELKAPSGPRRWRPTCANTRLVRLQHGQTAGSNRRTTVSPAGVSTSEGLRDKH